MNALKEELVYEQEMDEITVQLEEMKKGLRIIHKIHPIAVICNPKLGPNEEGIEAPTAQRLGI